MLAADIAERYSFSIRQCGPLARSILEGGGLGRVVAVFDRTFYVEIGGRIGCVVGGDMPVSALNMVSDATSGVNWRASGLRRGQCVRVMAGELVVAQTFRFETTRAERWAPDAIAADWDEDALRAGLRRLRSLAQLRVEYTGILELLRERLPISLSNFDCVHRLLGAGPGLTPAGDDFVGGLMIGLHAAGVGQISERLWQELSLMAKDRTNAISIAHLEGASMGIGSEPIHRMITAVLMGCLDDIDDLARNIDGIGHTSGWDIMAGVVCAVEAVLVARQFSGAETLCVS